MKWLRAVWALLAMAALANGEAKAGEDGGELVAGLRAVGADVTFLGVRGSLKGWLVAPPGRSSYTLYVDGTGHGVMGLLFAPDGDELTEAQVAAAGRAGRGGPSGNGDAPERARAGPAATQVDAGPGRQQADGGAAFDLALMGEGFGLGKEGPLVAVFADPTCPPSRAAVAELASLALEGKTRLRVVPVGVRSDEAGALAAAVLDSRERAKTWFQLGGDGVTAPASREAEAGVALNGKLLQRTGSGFVPYAVMQRPDGSVASAVGLDFRRWFGK